MGPKSKVGQLEGPGQSERESNGNDVVTPYFRSF